MSPYAFLDPKECYPLPDSFDFEEYIETEREMWALFPETDGKRVNFCQMGLTAKVYVESGAKGELEWDETYFLMPCADRTLRPVRMKALRRLTLMEFRMGHITAVRLAEKLCDMRDTMEQIHLRILDSGILES